MISYILSLGNLFLFLFIVFFTQEQINLFVILTITLYAISAIGILMYILSGYIMYLYTNKLNVLLSDFELQYKCKVKISKKQQILYINWGLNNLGVNPDEIPFLP